MRWSIRAKLVTLVLAVLLPLVAGALVKFWHEQREARERAQERLLLTAQGVARQLDEVVTGQIENLETLAALRDVERIETDRLAALARRVQATHPFVRAFLALSTDGTVLASSIGGRSRPPLPRWALLHEALRSGEPVVGGPQPSPIDGRSVVPIALAVQDATRAPRGVAVVELDSAALSTFLDVFPLGAAGVTVVAPDGALVARSAAATVAGGTSLVAGADAARLARPRGGAAEWTSPAGAAYLVGISGLSRTPWVVLATIPAAMAADPVEGRLYTNLSGLAAVTLLALLVAWLIGLQMTRAVHSLTGAARRLAAGQPTPVAVRGSDELAELADQFNRAIDEREATEGALEARQRRLEALAEINLSLSQQLDLERLLQQITDALVRLTGAQVVVFWGAEVAERRLVRRAWTIDPSVVDFELPMMVGFEQGGAGWIASHREPLFVPDVASDARVLVPDWAIRHDLRALAGVPVVAGDELVGVLSLNLERGRTFGADDLALLLTFASQAAVAVRNARLFAEARARSAAAEAVAEMGRVLAQALDADLVAPRIADNILALLGACASGLYRVDPDTGDLAALALSGDVGAHADRPLSFPSEHGLVGLAVRERRLLTTPNLLTDDRVVFTPEARARVGRASFRAALAVPLVVKDAVIGVLAVGHREGHTFTSDEVRLAQTFADQAALALGNARLFAEVTARRREAEELTRVARMLAESLDLSEVGRRVVDSVLPLFRAVSSALYLLEPSGSMRAVAWGGRAQHHFEVDHLFPRGVGIMARAAASGAPAWCRDVLSEPGLDLPDDMRRRIVAAGNRAVLAVPLRVKGHIIGVLSVADETVRDFSGAEASLLEAFGDQAAVALEDARLFAIVEQRRREAEELARVGRALAQSLDPDVVARQIVESLQALFAVRSAILFRLGEAGELEAWVSFGAFGQMAPSGPPFPRGTALAGLAVRDERPVASADLRIDARVSPEMRARLYQEGIQAELAVPLMVRGRMIGALSLGDARGRLFDEADVRLAQAFADEAALVLENARLYVESTRRRREAEELARLARMLTGSLDVAEVGRRIVDSVLPMFRASFARLRLKLPDGSLRAVAGAGSTAEHLGAALPPGFGAAGRAVVEGRTVRYTDALTDPALPLTDDLRQVLVQSGARSVVGVPLRVGDEIIGALTLGALLGRAFTDEEVALAEAFADQAALALDNARLYEQTRQRLRQVDSVREVVEQILGSFSLEDRLSLIARKAAELLDSDRATVALMSESGDTLVIRAGYRLFEGEAGVEIPLGSGGLGLAASRRETVLVNDYQAWPERLAYVIERQGERPVHAVIACPLLIRDEVIGALSVGVHDPARRYTEADLEQLTILAAPAALAIEHSRLYERLEAHLRELQETQAQLVQVAKLSAVGQLVSGVAHELNNPLSVVIGHGQLMLTKDLPPDIRRPVELIVSQGDRMAKIVQGLLLFSRQREPTRGPVDVTHIVGQILDLRTAQLRLSSIGLDVEHEVQPLYASGDAHQLQQVFLNLVLNAEQAILGSQAGGRIWVRTRARADGGAERTVVEVGDNGPGIPPEVLPRIFDPFFTTKPVGKGTGLGLSVSYGIVEQHGGRLVAESRPGHTVFTVELPAVGRRRAAAEPAAPGAAAPRSIGAGRHALVVEDELDIVDLVTTLLTQTGWRVDVSEGGRPALERVRATCYDLIVSDMRMPDGSGEEFYRAATVARPELTGRFLFVTGDTANPDAWKFLEETKAPVLAKPFTAEALLRGVEQLLA
jgi:GAF domain-containing protein/CheY-like chemotaxis protein